MINFVRFLVNDFVSLLDQFSGCSTKSVAAKKFPRVFSRNQSPCLPQPIPRMAPPRLNPTRLYHGSTLENVTEIFRTHLFLVGNSKPPAFWMADTPQKTRSYCGSDGGILVIGVVVGTPLTNRGGGVYIFEIQGAQPYRERYQIPYLVPVAILDPNGTTRIM